MSDTITTKEKRFCDYYIKGSAPYAGDAALCYLKIFTPEVSEPNENQLTEANIAAKALLCKEEIKEYLEELVASSADDNESLKRYVTESLKAILRETSSAQYRDRRGTVLSPAPLRSVAVQAAKALMELHPIKAAQSHNLNINGDGDGGITFNVIVPNQQSKDSDLVK